MSLKNYSHDEIVETSMIDLANLILLEDKKAEDFREIFDRIAELKGLSTSQRDDFIAQFYTDLNLDGRFMPAGNNLWGLKRWFPADQVEEDATTAPKKKKKKGGAKKKEAPKASKAPEPGFDEDPEDDNFDFNEEALDFDEEVENVAPVAEEDAKVTENDDYEDDVKNKNLDEEDQEFVGEDASPANDDEDEEDDEEY